MFIKAVSFHQHLGLGIVQFVASEANHIQYRTLSAALRTGDVSVQEVSASGDVNRLLVENRSTDLVFMMDGDILVGAKQNRVVNTSILLAPNVTMKIPVSCVEQGRWSAVSEKFSGSTVSAPFTIRGNKSVSVRESLRTAKGHAADQGGVWDAVSEFHTVRDVHSNTGDLTDAFRKERMSEEEIKEHFPLHEGASGAAVFFGGEFGGMDLFHRTEVYAEYFGKIVRSAVMESYGRGGKRRIAAAKARYSTEEMFDTVLKLPMESFPGVAEGTERRFRSENITGHLLEYRGMLIHGSILSVTPSRRRVSRRIGFDIIE